MILSRSSMVMGEGERAQHGEIVFRHRVDIEPAPLCFTGLLLDGI